MNFLFSANNNYIVPVIVSIISILENHKKQEINIYILESDFTEKSKNILLYLSEKYKKNIHIINVDEKYYSDVPALRWSKETYYRLLFNEVLPNNIERILYLDCDIIINRNILNFYNLDLEDKYIAAMPEISNSLSRIRIGLQNSGNYFQAGVILFDLVKSRSIINYEKSVDIIKSLGDKMIAVDQDVINIAFDGKIQEIEEKYNNCNITNYNGSNINRLFNIINKKEKEDTFIFHYATGKPWNNLFSGSCEDLWYKYLQLSPFSYLYYKKYNTFKYKILRTGLVKYFLFLYIFITPIIEKFFRKILPQSTFNKLKMFYRRNIK